MSKNSLSRKGLFLLPSSVASLGHLPSTSSPVVEDHLWSSPGGQGIPRPFQVAGTDSVGHRLFGGSRPPPRLLSVGSRASACGVGHPSRLPPFSPPSPYTLLFPPYLVNPTFKSSPFPPSLPIPSPPNAPLPPTKEKTPFLAKGLLLLMDSPSESSDVDPAPAPVEHPKRDLFRVKTNVSFRDAVLSFTTPPPPGGPAPSSSSALPDLRRAKHLNDVASAALGDADLGYFRFVPTSSHPTYVVSPVSVQALESLGSVLREGNWRPSIPLENVSENRGPLRPLCISGSAVPPSVFRDSDNTILARVTHRLPDGIWFFVSSVHLIQTVLLSNDFPLTIAHSLNIDVENILAFRVAVQPPNALVLFFCHAGPIPDGCPPPLRLSSAPLTFSWPMLNLRRRSRSRSSPSRPPSWTSATRTCRRTSSNFSGPSSFPKRWPSSSRRLLRLSRSRRSGKKTRSVSSRARKRPKLSSRLSQRPCSRTVPAKLNARNASSNSAIRPAGPAPKHPTPLPPTPTPSLSESPTRRASARVLKGVSEF